MPDYIDVRIVAWLRLAVRLGSFLTVLLGGALLVGVILAGRAVFADHGGALPQHLLVAPSTAVGLMLAGASLGLHHAGRRRAAAWPAAALLLFASSLLSCRIALHVDPFTAWLLGGHRPLRDGHLVRIAGITALLFVLLAVGSLGMASRWRRRRIMLVGTFVPGLALSGLVAVGYIYDVEPRSIALFYRDMSPAVAVLLSAMFLIGLAIEPEQGWLATLMSRLPGARTSRVQILLVTTIPPVVGLLLLRGERAGMIMPGLAMAVMAIGTGVPLVAQILFDGRRLDRLETRRQEAVDAEERLKDELERRVRDRTVRLERSEAQLRGFVDNAVEGLALLRQQADGALSVETASPSLLAIFGSRSESDRLPQPAERLIAPDVLADFRARVATCLEQHEPLRYRVRRSTRDGSRLLDVILAPINGDDTSRERLVAASVRDITDAEQREEQLRQSQKMEAVGQLTGGLAHDFNNLLTGISGSLEMIQARLGQSRSDDVERYLATAQEAGRRAAALTHRLLAFSRRQTLDPRLVEIDRIIAGMEELIRRTMGPVITVVVQPSARASTALIDANQFENALLNLCLNARDAMPEGGRLTIATLTDVVAPVAATPDLPAGDYVRVRVADSGVGMSPDLVARAFDPFFTTKPIGQGTGLGLSMIYGFVRQSGGRVELVSEPGRGTVVDLRLPLQPAAEAPRPAPVEPVPESVAGDGRTVLVVDDEPAIRMLVRDILTEHGYRTLEAEDGAGGLEILRSPATIDLLLTDVGLPNGMNGRQLADAARTLRRGLRVLFITGYAEATVFGDRVLDDGMEVLPKPFTVGRLIEHVGALAAPAHADARAMLGTA